MTKLEQAKLLLDFYFAPWGAAKGAIWETISHDAEFSEDKVIYLLNGIIIGRTSLSKDNVKDMKIVTG